MVKIKKKKKTKLEKDLLRRRRAWWYQDYKEINAERLQQEKDDAYEAKAIEQMLDYEKNAEPLDEPMSYDDFLAEFKEVAKDVIEKNKRILK